MRPLGSAGSNENTNGLAAPVSWPGTDLGRGQPGLGLNDVAALLNNRRGKTLGWRTPAEASWSTKSRPFQIQPLCTLMFEYLKLSAFATFAIPGQYSFRSDVSWSAGRGIFKSKKQRVSEGN